MPLHADRHIFWLAGVGVLILSLTGCAKQGGQMAFPKPQVSVVTLHAEPVTLSRELPGRTSAYQVADVRPQVSGIVKARLFTEGGSVRAGQPLYQLDDAIYRAQYQSAAATLAKAHATLDANQLAATRSAQLIKIDAVSAQDNENAVAALRSAQADIAAAQAALENARINVAYARIASPITGRIGKSSVTAGALVTAAQATALATVQQLDPIYVDVNQASSEWLKLRQQLGSASAGTSGTPVSILLDDGSTYAHDGTLQFSEVTVDPATNNFLLRVLVPNPDGLLLPGMYLRARIQEAKLAHAILAPAHGVSRDEKGNATALIVDANGKAQLRTITANRTVGEKWLVEQGLQDGDRIIVDGLQSVKPGMDVTAVEAH